MIEHGTIRKKLALAAAGALRAEDLRQIEEHARECRDCQSELEVWGLYARGMRQLPQPAAPADLIVRTQARILHEREAAASRRFDAVMVGVLALLSWLVTFGSWVAARFLTGGVLDVFGMNLMGAGPWFGTSVFMAWVTAGVAVVALGRARVMGRNL